MQKEKENVITPQAQELLQFVWDNFPSNPQTLMQKRDLLQEWYLEWLNNVGPTLYDEDRQEHFNLFWSLNEFLKLALSINNKNIVNNEISI